MAMSAIFFIFSGGVTAPVGLFGETRTITLVLSLIFPSIISGINEKLFFS